MYLLWCILAVIVVVCQLLIHRNSYIFGNLFQIWNIHNVINNLNKLLRQVYFYKTP